MKVKRIIVGPLKTNCYLVSSGKEAVVIDPGGDSNLILSQIKKAKVSPKFVVNTHSHFDHTDANSEILSATGAKLLKNLKEGDEVKVGSEKLAVIETPGHTDDSVSLFGKDFIITGDVLFLGGYGRTDLPGGSDEKMKKTLDRLQEEVLEDIVVYPGHGEPFKMKEWSY